MPRKPAAARSGIRPTLPRSASRSSVRDTPGHPIVLATDHAAQGHQGLVLRPLRRAARRPAGALDRRALRAGDRDTARWQQGNPRPRLFRRQGAVDDLRRSLPGLEGGDGQAADPGDRAAGGRRGIGRGEPARISRCGQGRACRRCRDDLRHEHVGQVRRLPSPPACAACAPRRSSSTARTATCIRVSMAPRR